MNKEDREFLKELRNEMLSQDTVCQTNPRFWVVMQTVKEYWVDDDISGIFIYSANEGGSVFEGNINEELAKWIKEEIYNIKICECDDGYIEFKYYEEKYCVTDTFDLEKFLEDVDSTNYEVGYYRNREEIVQDTLFLTLRECKEHIEANKYHYNLTAHPYCMTAWRSPQVAKLYKILEETDWDNI